MKSILLSIALLGIAAGAFALISLKGENDLISEKHNIPAAGAIPPIDSHMPGRIDTATFALG